MAKDWHLEICPDVQRLGRWKDCEHLESEVVFFRGDSLKNERVNIEETLRKSRGPPMGACGPPEYSAAQLVRRATSNK